MNSKEKNKNLGQPRADRDRLESPLEEQFAQSLEKYLSPSSEIYPQYEVQTILGKFRLDFMVALNGHKIGFECDGKEFHDPFRDEWRDALILNSKEIDTIYRFRGKDIFSFLDDCIYIIFMHDPIIFNERYKYHYNNLVSPDTLSYFVSDRSNFKNHEDTHIQIDIKNEDGKSIGIMHLETIRRGQNTDGHWKQLIKFIQSNPDLSLDELIRKKLDKL